MTAVRRLVPHVAGLCCVFLLLVCSLDTGTLPWLQRDIIDKVTSPHWPREYLMFDIVRDLRL